MSAEVQQVIDPVPYIGGSKLDVEATLGEIQKKIAHLPDHRAYMTEIRQIILAQSIERRWSIINQWADTLGADIILATPMTEKGTPFGVGKTLFSNEITLPKRP